MYGWAPEDYDRNVQGFLAPKEKEYFNGLDFKAHGFHWSQADKAWKHGWEIYDETNNRWAFSVSLDGEVVHDWQHDYMGHISDEGILEKMRKFLDTQVDEQGRVKGTGVDLPREN